MSRKVRVALAGVGNCASSLVQGIEFYRDADPTASIPGLMHVELGGYHIRDIEFSAAFDVSDAKVGKDLASAIRSRRTTPSASRRCPTWASRCGAARRWTALAAICASWCRNREPPTTMSYAPCARPATDVLVCYLPVGSQEAATWYAEQALAAGCAFVNCIPVFIASREEWRRRFRARGLPLIGDDIKSQVGATIVHRLLANLFRERGVRLDRTYQLNFGGNTDFLNMLERDRLESKKISKTQAVTSQLGHELPAGDVHVGPSDYVPWLTDRKFCHIRLEGTAVRQCPANMRAEARGVGLAQFRRCGDRRGALRQARAGPRPERRALRPLELVHEVAATPIHRRRGPPADGGVHPRRGAP